MTSAPVWEPLIREAAHVACTCLAADWLERHGDDRGDDAFDADEAPVSVCAFGAEIRTAAEVAARVAEIEAGAAEYLAELERRRHERRHGNSGA